MIFTIRNPKTGEITNIPAITGKSAYEIAVEEGFEGTKEDWLNSLRGGNDYTRLYNKPTINGKELSGDCLINETPLKIVGVAVKHGATVDVADFDTGVYQVLDDCYVKCGVHTVENGLIHKGGLIFIHHPHKDLVEFMCVSAHHSFMLCKRDNEWSTFEFDLLPEIWKALEVFATKITEEIPATYATIEYVDTLFGNATSVVDSINTTIGGDVE